MAIFKCKMCGASLEIEGKKSIVTCEYCDTQQTLPRLQDARIANLYDRANHFRRNNDFDKAMGIYETILNEDTTDAEAYWSLVLCRYGIEYVEDPLTKKRIPTVNRAQFTSIFDDENYKSALAHADSDQRKLYEAEANAINEIQKGILAISQNEEPFDVFICYKETDANGKRTMDSVLATELYQELTREGFKVFFARITLEDKLGVAYEPYIFAALQSAKVMVVLGTRPEHFNAVWVKNEWSRYLSLIKGGAKKTLIPAYRDMDPYDLPEEFSHLQAQDMSKLGYLQDLTRGIGKIVGADKPSKATEPAAGTSGIAPLLKRAFLALEDGEFDRADQFCEQVLNQDPENAQAYLGKLMAELKVTRKSGLQYCNRPFDFSKNYQKLIRFADSALAGELKGYLAAIKAKVAKSAEEAHQRSLELQRQNQEAARKAEEARIQEETQRRIHKEQQAQMRRAKEKKRKIVATVSILLVFALALVGYFGVFPWIALQNGEYKIYVEMYMLKEFTIPDGVTEIKDEAFLWCPDLISVHIPDSVTTIGDNAFTRCTSLTSVTFPDGLTEIGYGAFSYCDSLTEITLPESITRIEGHAFSNSAKLAVVNIPDSVTEIGEYAFTNCPSIEEITLPVSIQKIEDSAFYCCTILATIHYTGTVEQWNSISKGSNWHSAAYSLTVHCTDGDITE